MVYVDLSSATIAEAQALRAERDRQFNNRNRYPVHGYETRWAGDAGELAGCYWLSRENVPARWYKLQPAGKCDFRVRRADVELKTACYHVPPRPESWVGMGADHARRIACDFFWFMCFQKDAGRMWIPGAIERNRFCYYAAKIPKGSRPPGWKVDAQEDRFEIQLERLTHPRGWLRQLEQEWSVRQ